MIMIGDLHGEYINLLYKITKLELTNTTFIQVGDFGLGFHDLNYDLQTLTGLNKFLKQRNNKLYIVRGNHDNPFFWKHNRELHLTNIFFAQDYEVLTIEDQRVLCIGGGISIDRLNRTSGKDYWPDEEFVLNEVLLEKACETEIDIVVTHIAPDNVWPYMFTPVVNHYSNREPGLAAALDLERRNMRKVYERVLQAGCKQWYYGHYHQSMIEEKNGVLFRCLDIGEMHRPSVMAMSD
jgi:UDP-2,3-diacylglucosamine pyrophosphatase LpxH